MDSKKIFQSYLSAFATPAGEVVLEDLEDAFVKRLNVELELNMQEFEHPYRAYVEIGQRMVVQSIQAAIQQGRKK